ncbi:MAG: SRPBCC family protein [Ilumatobacteraceae bacterium]
MVDSGSDTTIISATPEHCFSIASDFEKYPEWAHDVKEATVLDRDQQGRATKVEYRASAFGRSTHYTLAYDFSEAPKRLSWTLVAGDIMRSILGAYKFEPVSNGTRVTYDLAIELVIPLPGFVKRRAEVRILDTLKELKTRSES